MTNSKDYTLFIRNFDSKQVTHDLLLELFTQAGPVQNLTLKEDFAFVEFEDQESVMYACNLLNETILFGIPLQVKPRSGSKWENCELYQFPNQINTTYPSSYSDLEHRHHQSNPDNRQYGNHHSSMGSGNRSHNIINPRNDMSEFQIHSSNNNRSPYQQQIQYHNKNQYQNTQQQHHHNSYVEDDWNYRHDRPENRQSQNKYSQPDRRYHRNNSFSNQNFNEGRLENRQLLNRSFGSYRERPY